MARVPLRTSTGNAIANVNFSAMPTPSTPRMTTASAAPQSKVKGPDKRGMSTYACSRCDINYKVHKSRHAVCPLCEERRATERVREELKKAVGANDVLKRDYIRVKAQLSVLDGMREAVSELNEADAMFLKELIYRYRADPDGTRVSQALRKRRIESENGVAYRHEVSGWTVRYSGVEAIEYVASSIGGAMMSLQFSEALKVTGLKGAMEMLTKAMSKSMANAT